MLQIALAALLSAALIQVVPAEQTPVNNLEQKVVAAKPAGQVVSNTNQPAQDAQPVETPAPQVPEVQPEQATVVTPAPIETSYATGSCEAEIAKYDWGQSVALAVARAESGLNPGALNNNPATGDYSVGCFQVNIYGRNAYTRPSEAQLKNAAVNVAFAHKIYTGNGNSFLGQWGVCRHKVACY